MSGQRVVVTQLGARRHYAVPLAFQERGALQRLYTDIYAGSGIVSRCLRLVSGLLPLKSVRRLSGRGQSGLSRARVRSFPWFGAKYKWKTSRARDHEEMIEAWLWGGKAFCQLVNRIGFDSASTIYAYSSAALETFVAAKEAGLRCVLDHASAPLLSESRLVQDESKRLAGWAPVPELAEQSHEYHERQARECQLADVVVCGSGFVRSMIDTEWNAGGKCEVVPLATGTTLSPRTKVANRNGKLRVLFVGDDMIRKGIGDFVEALRQVGRVNYEARVVGSVSLSPFGCEQVEAVAELIGPVPRSEMHGQYEWADVCVLPSISDTFGLVVLEALAHGVPVITTVNTGASDIINEGDEGFVVPIHSPTLIGSRIAQLCDNRDQLAAMSDRAAELAGQLSQSAYASRLNQVIAPLDN